MVFGIGRRRWLRRGAWSAAALLSLAALRIALGKTLGDWVAARERTRFEQAVGSLDPARLAAPRLDDEANAAVAIGAAVARLDLDAEALDRLHRVARSPPSDTDLDALDTLLTEHDGRLSDLEVAARLPASSFGPRDALFGSHALAGIEWLRAARLTAADGRRALATGDRRRVERAQSVLHGMAVALRREPVVVFALFGIAAETLHLDLLRERISAGIDQDALAASARQIAVLRALPDAVAVAHGEGVFSYDLLRRQKTTPSTPASLAERIEALVWPWSEGHVEAGAIEGWRELARFAAIPQSEWPAAAVIARSRRSALRRWLDPTVPFETLRTQLVPSLLAGLRKLQFTAAAEQLGALAIEVSREVAATGSLPDDLVGFAEAGTPDPATRSPVQYRPLSGGGAWIGYTAAQGLARDVLLDGMPPSARGAYRLAGLLSWRLPSPVAARMTTTLHPEGSPR